MAKPIAPRATRRWVSLSLNPSYELLLLRLQLRLVCRNECANVIRHVEQLQPLLLVERHRKASHAVDRDGALLAHLHANTGCRAFLEGGIFAAQAVQLSLHIVVGHCFPSVPAMNDAQSTLIGAPLVPGRTMARPIRRSAPYRRQPKTERYAHQMTLPRVAGIVLAAATGGHTHMMRARFVTLARLLF